MVNLGRDNKLRALLTSKLSEEEIMSRTTVVDLNGKEFRVHLTPKRGRPLRRSTTIEELFERFKKSELFRGQSEGLQTSEKSYYRLHLLPFFKDCDIKDIKGLLQDYVEYREKDGAKPNTLNLEIRSLKKAIKLEDEGWEKPKLYYSNQPKKVNKGFRTKDLLPVIYAVTGSSRKYGSEYLKFGMVAALTSMRLKDIYDLTNANLDRKYWKIRFVQSKVRELRKAQGSNKENQEVVLDVHEKLKPIFEAIPADKKGRLFEVPSTKAVTTAFCKAFRDSNVKGSFHSFRHALATTMLANGTDVKSVQDILGHSSITTTMTYLHALDENKKTAITSVEI